VLPAKTKGNAVIFGCLRKAVEIIIVPVCKVTSFAPQKHFTKNA
jgi:hypothetical protein